MLAAGGGTVGTVSSGSLISGNDPASCAVVTQSLGLWQAAIGRPLPFLPTVLAANLPAGVLGETFVTGWNSAGQATGGIIVLSPNASGAGWYDDPAPGGDGTFTQFLASNASAAAPGSAAYGHYDLLTALLHEIGHIEGFMPSNPNFEGHVQTVGGSQVFVGPGVCALWLIPIKS